MNEKYIAIIKILLRFILAGVFLAAAVSKVINPADFVNDIENYRLLPPVFAALTAVVLPWMELVCAVLLLLNKWVKPSALLLILMTIVFIAAISSAMIRGLDIECGCFSGDSTVGVVRLIEDVLLLTAALTLYRLEPHTGRRF